MLYQVSYALQKMPIKTNQKFSASCNVSNVAMLQDVTKCMIMTGMSLVRDTNVIKQIFASLTSIKISDEEDKIFLKPLKFGIRNQFRTITWFSMT